MRPTPLVLVTRPTGDDSLAAALEARGYRVAAVPTIEVRAMPSGGALDAALADAEGWDWIVVTSVVGARATAEAMARTGTRAAGQTRWAAVGPATADTLAGLGIRAEVVPQEPSGEGLARDLALRTDLRGRRILLPRADAASADLPDALRRAGATVLDVVAYHTLVAPQSSLGPLSEALRDADLACAVVASGSAVRGLLRLAADLGMDDEARELSLIAIGPRTADVARDLGFRTVVEASRASSQALVTAVEATIHRRTLAPAATTGRTT